ncbi:MAG: hypothetical protein HY925_03765 [Elusimicrobia bacterium]|nr:hypothetical protein [Elusimicrobiota bacterium]
MVHFFLAAYLITPLAAWASSADYLPAKADVSASSGAVQLSLRIYETHVSSTEGLWYQIEVKNLGSEPLLIMDRVFFDPGHMHTEAANRAVSTFLEITDAAGRRVPTGWPLMPDPQEAANEPWPPEPYIQRTPEMQALKSKWQSEGVSEEEITRRLIKRQGDLNYRAERESRPRRALQKGESIVTPPWFNHGFSYTSQTFERDKRPRGQFAEANYFSWRGPGAYRVRAVYEHAPMSHKSAPFPGRVKVRTPWITVNVR